VQPCFSQYPFCAVIKVTASDDALSVNGWAEVWPANGTLDQTNLDFSVNVELKNRSDPFGGLVAIKEPKILRTDRGGFLTQPTDTCKQKLKMAEALLKIGGKRDGRRDSEYTEQTLGAGMGYTSNGWSLHNGLSEGISPPMDIPKCRAKEAGLEISTLADGMIRKAVAKLRFEVMMGPNYVSNFSPSASEPWWRRGCMDTMKVCGWLPKNVCVNGGKGFGTPDLNERTMQGCCVCGGGKILKQGVTRTPTQTRMAAHGGGGKKRGAE